MIPEEKLTEIRDRLPLVEFISEYVPLKKVGKNHQGLCPFHQEKTPSFYVSPERETFHCFGCGAGGTLFHFLMKIEGLTFHEAVERMAERTGVQVETQHRVDTAGKERRARAFEMNRQAAWYYHCLLKKLPREEKVWTYLNQRQIPETSVEEFHLGFCPPHGSGLKDHLLKKGFSSKELEGGRLFKGGREFFRGRLIFPIFTGDKKVAGFGGRKIDEKDFGPKYLNSSESEIFKKGELFYGIHLAKQEIRKKNQVLLTEGYLDVITLHSHGFREAIAPLGTAFTASQARLLKRLCEEVILLFDGDTAGEKASLRALEVLLAQGISPHRATLEMGEDPDSFLKRYGRLAFEKKLTFKRNLLEELIDKGATIIPKGASMLEQKGQTASHLLTLIDKIPNSITKNLYRRRLSEAMEIPEEWLPKLAVSPPAATQKPVKKLKPGWLPEEEEVLEIWLKFPELHSYIAENLSEEDFCTDKMAEIFRVFWELFREKGDASTGNYFDLAPSDTIGLLSELSMRTNGLEDAETARRSLEQALPRLKEKKLQQELRILKGKVDPHQVELIQEKISALSQLFKNKKRVYGQN